MARVRVGQLRAVKQEWQSVFLGSSMLVVVGAREEDGRPMVTVLQDGELLEMSESSVRKITSRVDEVRRG
jgi:hypothetical protein